MAKNIISDIYFSRAFRRMAGKTQLFSTYDNDHFHNRLTHTLEVTNISEKIYEKIGCVGSIYVITAASLAHDLGHTPFGHAGERAINEITYHVDDLGKTINQRLANKVLFKHNYYSAKVLLGINVNNVKINTILAAVISHTDLKYNDYPLDEDEIDLTLRFYLKNYRLRDSVIRKIKNNIIESQIVSIADEIAQRVSDLHDIALAKVFTITSEDMKSILPKDELEKVEGYPDKFRIKSLMSVYKDHLIEGVYYVQKTNQLKIKPKQMREMEHIKSVCKTIIRNSKEINDYDNRSELIVKYIFKELYKNPFLIDKKMVDVIYSRIAYLTKKDFNKGLLSGKKLVANCEEDLSIEQKCKYLKSISKESMFLIDDCKTIDVYYSHYLRLVNSELIYGIAFYIANMTDRFALEKYKDLRNNKKRP